VARLDAEGASGAPVIDDTALLARGDARGAALAASELFQTRALPAPAIIRPSTALILDHSPYVTAAATRGNADTQTEIRFGIEQRGCRE
jgi:hypothetical protein